MLRLLGQAPLDESLQRVRNGGVDRPDRRRIVADDRTECLDRCVPRERAPAGQQLEQHHPERELIRCENGGPARSLFGRHVPDRAENHAIARQSAIGEGIDAQIGASVPDGRFASPKSSTFTVPSRRSLTFADLRSRWMTPRS